MYSVYVRKNFIEKMFVHLSFGLLFYTPICLVSISLRD